MVAFVVLTQPLSVRLRAHGMSRRELSMKTAARS